ncbi:FadR family transcriptional regulator [Aquibacillus sp. LR5S19]|uniref:FadR family transcriptional regulator n=1 Tax=Aquibacillus rhizosphaerae TaxID=3051431 RepID=A0ABT7L478_9BACI|nr:FadR family transcriptional regulator [Aquibacillus sp. LR5S19]MDL4840668.1 FadR family transcriptional regulator [Aquibacillus sp. LR5S19]
MELLGLIETRRGEGTFLKTYRTFRTVELLSAFILHEHKTRDEIISCRTIIEKEAVKLAFKVMKKDVIEELQTTIDKSQQDEEQRYYSFFIIIFEKADNFLLQKIWMLLDDFSRSIKETYYMKQFYIRLLNAFSHNEYEDIELIFEQAK